MRIFCLSTLIILSLYSKSQEYHTDTLRIYFPLDITTIGEAGKVSLDSLASLVKRNKKAKLSITGYADYLGTNPHNVDLSVSRALKVRDDLILKGVDSLQIKLCEGKGALNPGETRNKVTGIPFHRRTDVVVTWPVLKKPASKKANGENNPPFIEKTLPMSIKNLKKGDQIVLKNLNFIGGRHTLISQSYNTLYELTNIMKQNPSLKIEIQGHICCDSISDDGYDYDSKTDDLSVQRAFS